MTANPALAEAQAREILKTVPGQTHALWALSMALLMQDKRAESADVLRALVKIEPAHI
jgi:hypothetical protein